MTKKLSDNRRAYYSYEIVETFEAGLVLYGWEVKSMRSGRAQIVDAHIVVKKGELFLINCHLTPLISTSSHIVADPVRSRKLLLHEREIKRLIGKVKEKGLTLIPLDLHLLRNRIKTKIGLVRGKKKVDKRRSIEKRDWEREQRRALRGKS